MIDDLRHKGLRRKMIQYLKDVKGIVDDAVLHAMMRVPRHLFLESSLLDFAYVDKPFPIGSDQTISSIYTVAFQTQCLDIKASEKILEIGTGSGYQTSVLLELGAEVYSIERHHSLYKKAQLLLNSLHYSCNLFYSDGYLGLENHAPFDKILVTCGAVDVPPMLLQQLKKGGKMVIPVGFKTQIMTVIYKDFEGNLTKKEHENFKFVPLLRDRS